VALADELGFGADTIEVLAGGNQNHAVRLRTRSSDVVLRFARDTNRLTMDAFDVEQWCSRAAAEAGIATPATLARAQVRGHSVIVQEFVPGAPAGLFSRFGRDLDAAWIQHIDYNLEALTPGNPPCSLTTTVATWSSTGARPAWVRRPGPILS
jgi:hypothetical protein